MKAAPGNPLSVSTKRSILACFVLLCSAAAAQVAADEDCIVTIVATVPDNTPTLYLAGNHPSLGRWKPDGIQMEGTGRERTTRFAVPMGTDLEYKFTLGSWEREALGPSGMVMPNFKVRISGNTELRHEVPSFKKEVSAYLDDWQNSGVLGRLVYWRDVASEYLGAARHVSIWLPPGYDEDLGRRYPVLYMSDGQNLFDPRIANTGTDWGVDEAVVDLVDEEAIEPIIVVGIWSTAARGREYSPWHLAPQYARFLIEELMPRVDSEFRTMTDAAHTAHMGSSMGGLLSYYLAMHHPTEFGAGGCLSTHFPLSEEVAARIMRGVDRPEKPDATPYVLRDIEGGLTVPPGTRLWFDYGTKGLDSEYGPTHDAVRQWLVQQQRIDGTDFVIRCYEEADHNEASWRERLGDPLRFLFESRAAD
jgi:enterochelin esterase-like enzyme